MSLLDKIRSLFGAGGTGNDQKQTKKLLQGKITYFNHKKGYGFITPDHTDKQVFLHISEMTGRPRKGLLVNYEIEPDPKGDRAVRVHAST